MFAIPGICALIVFILARPQEFLEVLQKVPLLYIFCAAALGGYLLDLKLRRLEFVPAVTFGPVVLYILWSVICTAIKAPDTVMGAAILMGISFVLYGTIAHGVQRFRALEIVAGTVLVTCMFLTVVGVHQGLADNGCIKANPENLSEGTPDGRPCDISSVCYGEGAEPGADYVCEPVGLFGTYAVQGRVRYRGELEDPNALGLIVCIGGLSFLIAFAARRHGVLTVLALVVGGAAVIWCVLLTQSRGAVLVVMGVIGVYFVRRYGVAGIVVAGLLAAPMMMFGGRSGSSADESTMLRYEAWATGLQMFKQSPVVGVGYAQFTNFHFLTAHNSFVLALAETGMVGMILWFNILYLSFKILIVAMIRLSNVPGAKVARVWGIGLLASMVGLVIQMNFLSFAYHSLTWIFFGLCSAYAGAVRHHDPTFEIRYGWRDFFVVVGICFGLALFFLPLFLRTKGVM